MDAEDILDGLIRGALGSGRKRSRGALRVLGGGGSLINARTLLAAAGVAWGLYEASQKPTVPATTTPVPGSTPPVPPIPAARAGALPAHVLRLVRLTISAARADGDLSLEERGAILEHARDLGAEAVVAEELQTARPLAEIVAGASDPKLKADLYTLAFTLVRADENVSGAERIYLAQLAHQLGLDAPTAALLEAEAAARIDAEAAK
jgi:uncharacterized membrane protein YebE (DUF533 family)